MAARQCILVVDDEPQICDVVELYLRREGFEVETAHDGQAALNAVEHDPPDLVVLDVMMPTMDGHAFIREIKCRPELQDIPILILTARAQTKYLFEEMGIMDFVSKPFSPQELLNSIETCIAR